MELPEGLDALAHTALCHLRQWKSWWQEQLQEDGGQTFCWGFCTYVQGASGIPVSIPGFGWK